MTKTMKVFALAFSILVATCGAALATPSTQVWIPSTDIQAYKTLHLGLDNYIRTSKDSDGRRPHVYDAGLTVGVLPFEKLQMEIGIDYLVNGFVTDEDPIYFNTKIGTPEGSLFKYSPALAVGIYNLGTNWDNNSGSRNDYNLGYALVAKTLPVIGRLSAGYYIGNAALLKDGDGNHDNDGVLLSWDRTLSEISDKLWAAIDYQSGDNYFGALNFGLSWAFSKNVSVIFGYDIYNNHHAFGGGQNTFTTQVDINFP